MRLVMRWEVVLLFIAISSLHVSRAKRRWRSQSMDGDTSTRIIVDRTLRNFKDARNYCYQRGRDIVAVNNERENRELADKAKKESCGTVSLGVAIIRQRKTVSWTPISYRPSNSFDKWMAGQPANNAKNNDIAIMKVRSGGSGWQSARPTERTCTACGPEIDISKGGGSFGYARCTGHNLGGIKFNMPLQDCLTSCMRTGERCAAIEYDGKSRQCQQKSRCDPDFDMRPASVTGKVIFLKNSAKRARASNAKGRNGNGRKGTKLNEFRGGRRNRNNGRRRHRG